MIHLKPSGRITAAALVMGLALPACSDTNTLGPDNQLEVANVADNFQFQVSNMDNVEQTETYTWANTGTQAVVDISPAITSGSVILTVTDGAGTQVYQDDLANDNDGDTTVGVTGDWTIRVQIQKASGTVNFRVQKKT